MRPITLAGPKPAKPIEEKLCGGDIYRANAPVAEYVPEYHRKSELKPPDKRKRNISRFCVMWTDEQVARLKELRAEKLRTFEIAAILNKEFPNILGGAKFTKNAVIGKLHRIDGYKRN